MADKPNCYECAYRGTIPGNAHSCCHHPAVKHADSNSFGAMVQAFSGEFTEAIKELGVTAEPHGVKSGWFVWPANFDPTWLLTCNGFKDKQEEEYHGNISSR